MTDINLCYICEESTLDIYTCDRCDIETCLKCYDEDSGLCIKCLQEQ